MKKKVSSGSGSKGSNTFLIFSIVGGLVVFALIAFVLINATATTKAAVLSADGTAGTVITSEMVEEIDVPKDTPGDFYKNRDQIVGERLTSNVKKDQLIYKSDLMSSVEVAENTPVNYITTSIKVDDDNALGGLLVAGDVIDVAVVPDEGNVQSLAAALPGFNVNTGVNGGIYYILSNVKLLDTTTAVSSSEGSNMSTATGSTDSSSSQNSAYYMMSLSYDDYKKLRIAEQYGKLYLNLSPKQNETNAPLLKEMTDPVTNGLDDSTSAAKYEDGSSSSDKSSSDSSNSGDQNQSSEETNN